MSDRGWEVVENMTPVLAIAAVVICISIFGCESKVQVSSDVARLEQKIDQMHRVVVGSRP